MADAQAHPWPSSPSTLASWVNPSGLVALNIHCRNSLVVQCLRLRAPNAGGLGSILGQGTRSHTLQGRSKILSATTKSTHAASEDPTHCGEDPTCCSEDPTLQQRSHVLQRRSHMLQRRLKILHTAVKTRLQPPAMTSTVAQHPPNPPLVRAVPLVQDALSPFSVCLVPLCS